MPENAVIAHPRSKGLEAIEKVLIGGDLSVLNEEQRLVYYHRVCESLHLNPLTKPFDYIKLNGKLVLYANRSASDQLRSRDSISAEVAGRELIGDVYVVTVNVTRPDGRSDSATGVVATANLAGEALANAMMKAETKAKRRATLSICGLGMLDESEVDGELAAAAATPHFSEPQPVITTTATATEAEQIPGIRVLSARVVKSGTSKDGPWTLHAVKFSDDKEFTTLSKSLYEIAKGFAASKVPVSYETEVSGSYTNVILIEEVK